MKTKMLVVAAGAAFIIASPAFAKSARHPAPYAATYGALAASSQFVVPRHPHNVYGPGGEYLGRDPDPNVRLQLRREGEWWQGGE